MKTSNNFYINKTPFNLIKKINNSPKKNTSEKKIDLDFPRIPKFIKTKNKIPFKKITSRNNNERSIKVNKSNYLSSYKKEKSSDPLMKKFLKYKIRNKLIFEDNNCNYTFNFRQKKKSSEKNKKKNTNIKYKEFNKIILFESLKNVKTQRNKINIKNINKFLMKNKSMDKNFTEYSENNRQNNNSNVLDLNNFIHLNKTDRILEKENKFVKSTKLIKAHEKWKRNYLATVIQKTYRGFIFRKKFLRNYKKEKLNIYIKKLPKNKSFGNNIKKINFKNKLINKNIISNIIYKSDKKEILNNRNYSSKKFPKIKEIIIKRRKNSPVVNLNLNNCFLNAYNENYNIFNNNNILKKYDIKITTDRKENGEKYWEKIHLFNKLKNNWNYWIDISLKNKIIKSFISLKMKDKNNIKSDETYNSTNPYSEDKKTFNYSKNAKLFYVKK